MKLRPTPKSWLVYDEAAEECAPVGLDGVDPEAAAAEEHDRPEGPDQVVGGRGAVHRVTVLRKAKRKTRATVTILNTMKMMKISRPETRYPGAGGGRGGAVAEEAVDVVVIRAEAWSAKTMKKKSMESK